jgi:hypothetical protein
MLIVSTLFVASPAKADSYNIDQLGAPDFSGHFAQAFGASGTLLLALNSTSLGRTPIEV